MSIVKAPSKRTSIYVVIATKGRSPEVGALLQRLRSQSLLPERVIVVGTCSEDLPPLDADAPFEVRTWIAARAGITVQRNEGITILTELGLMLPQSIVVFFDDDFRPRSDWLMLCAEAFAARPDVGALTGLVLADGINRRCGLSEEEADRFLDGSWPAQGHWTTGPLRDIGSLYGCNMAFAGSVLQICRFDEELPLYGWQEDRDIAGQVRSRRRVIIEPTCRGVHLGSGNGRTSGLRFGYSQIANIVYLQRKGTVEASVTIRFLARALASNILHTVHSAERRVYASRLHGNVLAIADLLRGTCLPRRIVELS